MEDIPRRNIDDILKRWKKIVSKKNIGSEAGVQTWILVKDVPANKSVEEHEIDDHYNNEGDVDGENNFSKYKVDQMSKNCKFKLA